MLEANGASLTTVVDPVSQVCPHKQDIPGRHSPVQWMYDRWEHPQSNSWNILGAQCQETGAGGRTREILALGLKKGQEKTGILWPAQLQRYCALSTLTSSNNFMSSGFLINCEFNRIKSITSFFYLAQMHSHVSSIAVTCFIFRLLLLHISLSSFHQYLHLNQLISHLMIFWFQTKLGQDQMQVYCHDTEGLNNMSEDECHNSQRTTSLSAPRGTLVPQQIY